MSEPTTTAVTTVRDLAALTALAEALLERCDRIEQRLAAIERETQS